MDKSTKRPYGGARPGAGRPKGTGKFKASTKTMRIPAHRMHEIEQFLEGKSGYTSLPFYTGLVQAGMPSAISDEATPERYQVFDELAPNPEKTFVVRATGESMIGAGIYEGDMLVVDRSLPAKEGAIVIASVNGDFTVKRVRQAQGFLILMPENPEFPPISIGENDNVEFFGVVTHAIHSVR